MEKLISLEQFQNDPKLQAEFGGDYSKYLENYYRVLYKTDVFTLGNSSNPYALNMSDISIWGSKETNPNGGLQYKRFEEIVKNLDKIDSKYRQVIETELNKGNVYRAFIYMQIALDKSKLKGEFTERSKEADLRAAAAEEAYYVALEAEKAAEKAQRAAERYLEEMVASYKEGDYHIVDAQKKLKDLINGMSDATLAREIAGDRWMRDEKLSLNEYYNSIIADTMLG